MTGIEGDRPATAPDDSRPSPRPAHGFATEWCIDDDAPFTTEPADAAPCPTP